MFSAAESTTANLAELQNWLKVAHEFPSKRRPVVERVCHEPNRWLPALVCLATKERTAAGQMAVTVLTTIASETKDAGLLSDLLGWLPRKSSTLAKVAMHVTERVIGLLRKDIRETDVEAAKLWNNLSERCQDAERPDLALQCAKKAVAICRALSVRETKQQRIQVECLLTLAKRFSDHGRHRVALSKALEGFEAASRLASAGDAEGRLLEAQAATILANRYAAVGEFERAIAAVSVARRFLRRSSKNLKFRYDLAMAEHSVANHLTRLGRHEEALPCSENAERLFRILNSQNRDENLECAAAAANTYAINLSETGNLQRSYDLSRTAAERMAELARHQPKRFAVEYTVYLISFSNVASELGRHREAVTIARDAVIEARKIGRRQRKRDWYLEGQAHTLLFNLLYRLQDYGQAADNIRAAVRAFRRLPPSHPEIVMESARALRHYAEALRMTVRLDKNQATIRVARRALATLKKHRPRSSNALLLLEAQCRTTLAACLDESGRLPEAIREEKVSVKIRRKLFVRSEKVHRLDLAYGLTQLGRRLLRAGDGIEASRLAAEAGSHFAEGLPGAPEFSYAWAADALRLQAETEVYGHCLPAAISFLLKGIQLLRPRYQANPDLWLSSLLPLCTYYVELCELARVEFELPLVEDVIQHGRKNLEIDQPK